MGVPCNQKIMGPNTKQCLYLGQDYNQESMPGYPIFMGENVYL
jgi:hypothetical protein